MAEENPLLQQLLTTQQIALKRQAELIAANNKLLFVYHMLNIAELNIRRGDDAKEALEHATHEIRTRLARND